MEQSAIAAEAGCVYIAPFVHELKALFEEEYASSIFLYLFPCVETAGGAHLNRYEGSEPILPLCVQAQHYFIQHNYATRVKAAGLNCVDEAKQLAGVASITLAPPLVHELAGMQENVTSLELRSLFKTVHADCAPGGAAAAERLSYINDEQKYRKAYHTSEGGKGRWKTDQVSLLPHSCEGAGFGFDGPETSADGVGSAGDWHLLGLPAQGRSIARRDCREECGGFVTLLNDSGEVSRAAFTPARSCRHFSKSEECYVSRARWPISMQQIVCPSMLAK